MLGLGMWTRVLDKAPRARLKARRKPSIGKSLLSKKRPPSSLGEFAVVHHAQSSLLSFSDEAGKGDDDPALVRTVKTLPVVGSDDPASRREKEARSGGGIPSQ